MITQKAISVKMDAETLTELDLECYVSAKKRNRATTEVARAALKGIAALNDE